MVRDLNAERKGVFPFVDPELGSLDSQHNSRKSKVDSGKM